MDVLDPTALSDRCLAVLDKLVRKVEHELDGVSADLAGRRVEEARLAAGRDELASQSRAALACIDRLQAVVHDIDIVAIERQRAWVLKLAELTQDCDRRAAELRGCIESLLLRVDALQRRVRVLQRARTRRCERLMLGFVRRHQRDADEQHLLRALAGVAT